MLNLIVMLLSSVNTSVIDWSSLNTAAKSVRKQEHPYHLVAESPLGMSALVCNWNSDLSHTSLWAEIKWIINELVVGYQAILKFWNGSLWNFLFACNLFELSLLLILFGCIVYNVFKVVRILLGHYQNGSMFSHVKFRAWYRIVNFFGPGRALFGVLCICVFHYLGLLTIGVHVSYFVISLFSIYGIGFYIFSWFFKNIWYPNSDEYMFRLLGHIQLACWIVVLSLLNLHLHGWELLTSTFAEGEHVVTTVQSTNGPTVSGSGRIHGGWSQWRSYFANSPLWRSFGRAALHQSPTLVNTYNALQDGSQAAAHIYASRATVITVGSALSGRYRVMSGRLPRPLMRVVGLGGVAVGGRIRVGGVAEGARSFQSMHGLLPSGMRLSPNSNSRQANADISFGSNSPDSRE